MKLIIATDNRFWRRGLGSQQRIYSLVEHLSKHYEVSIFFRGEPKSQDIAGIENIDFKVLFSSKMTHKISRRRDFLYRTYSLLVRALGRVFSSIKKLATDEKSIFVPTLHHYFDFHELQKFRAYIQCVNPQVVIIEYARLAYLGRAIESSSILTMIDTHDVGYLRYKQFTRNGSSAGLKITRCSERHVMKKFDYVLAIQLEDKACYRNIGVESVIYVPHAVVYNFVPPPPTKTIRFGFIGSTMQSNIDGINWFLEYVLPKITSKNIRILIAGSVCDYVISKDPRVVLLGFLDSLTDYYGEIHLSINPVQYGSGLKIKSVESICFSKPILTTEIGIEGMPRHPEAPYVICSSVEDWLSSFRKYSCLENLNFLVGRCEKYAQRYYSPNAAYKELVWSIDHPKPTS